MTLAASEEAKGVNVVYEMGTQVTATAGLVVALAMLCCYLLVSRAGLVRSNDEAQHHASRLDEQLAEVRRLNSLAEEVAAIGLWQYFPESGRQEWSAGMRCLFGADPEEEFLPGDGETLLSANGIDLISQVMARAGEQDRFSLRFTIMRLDGSMRALVMRVSVLEAKEAHRDRFVGVVMDVTRQAHREMRLLQSRQLALRAAREASELANTDPLTGLANRRLTMAELDRLIIRSRQDGEPLSIIVLDIDHFKQINDRHGHPVGDEVLKQVARLIRQQARKGDVTGRIGGEEFVWIVRGAECHIARGLAERLRQAIANAKVPAISDPVTVSLGFASLRDKDTGLALFARADQALYDAKGNGRNTVRMAA